MMATMTGTYLYPAFLFLLTLYGDTIATALYRVITSMDITQFKRMLKAVLLLVATYLCITL